MLVWNAMPSITPMMSLTLRLDSRISSMVVTTSSTTRPPCSAAELAVTASWLAWRAVSDVLRTVPPSCSIEAAVCCRLEACSSVRCDRSSLPLAIWLEPAAMDSLPSRTWVTTRASDWVMCSSSPSRRAGSSRPVTCTRTVRSPPATVSATRTACSMGLTTLTMMDQAVSRPSSTATTAVPIMTLRVAVYLAAASAALAAVSASW